MAEYQRRRELAARLQRQGLSCVAGILGTDNALRIVVTPREADLHRYHVKPGERLFVVPDLKVQEPVSGDLVPYLVAHAENQMFSAGVGRVEAVTTTVTGPTVAGAGSANNTSNLTFRPNVVIPAGSFLLIPAITDLADTAAVVVSDPNAGNVYEKLVGSQEPGTTASLWVFICRTVTPIATNQNISIDVPNGTQIAAAALFYGGAEKSSIVAITVQWNNTTTPSVSVPARNGDACLAIMGVQGPAGDTFTQDAAWGADLGGVGAIQYRFHGGARTAAADGPSTYVPVLGNARQCVTAVMGIR